MSATDTSLIVNAGSLSYIAGYNYHFYIQTTYMGLNYSQVFTVIISNLYSQVPLVTLGYICNKKKSSWKFCRFWYFHLRCRFNCIKFSTYQVLNPSSDIIIDASCTSGCSNISYSFQVYKNTGTVNLTINIMYSISLFLSLFWYLANEYRLDKLHEPILLSWHSNVFDHVAVLIYWQSYHN